MKKQGAVKQRQKKVLKKILENRGTSMSKAMKEAGYSDAYAKNPDQLAKTKTWQEVVEETFSDETLMEKHKELLEAKKPVFLKGMPLNISIPDYDIQVKALDMSYKIKGSYAPEKHQVVNPFEGLDDDELDAEIAKKEAELNLIKNKRAKKT